jgi:hypothetical protein
VGQAGAIAPLCVLLRSGSATTMLQAAAALSALSEQPEYQSAIVKGGAIAPLVRLLRVGQVADAQAAASIAIANVCATSAAAQEASAAELEAARSEIRRLISLLEAGSDEASALREALARSAEETAAVRKAAEQAQAVLQHEMLAQQERAALELGRERQQAKETLNQLLAEQLNETRAMTAEFQKAQALLRMEGCSYRLREVARSPFAYVYELDPPQRQQVARCCRIQDDQACERLTELLLEAGKNRAASCRSSSQSSGGWPLASMDWNTR